MGTRASRPVRPGQVTFPQVPPFLIAPSILAADFARLGEVVGLVEPHVDLLHVDVMDGHFVPNISLGIPVIASLRRVTKLTLDGHLMTTNPDVYLEDFVAAGLDLITVHIEAVPDPVEVATKVKELGARFGLVLNPPTPFSAIEPFAELCSMVLVMSVHPGFGGQVFIPEVLEKVEAARRWVESHGLATDIEIDGGINPKTVKLARDAGANVFVAGNAIFGAADPVAAVLEIRNAIDS